MKSSFGRVAYEVIEECDIIIEVLDARFISETRNFSIEQKIRKERKILVHVINKCEFVPKKMLLRYKPSLTNCVFVSAAKHLGTRLLKEKIMTLASQHKIKDPVVGVLGYPNVGKSSLINALKGSKSARTSAEAGFTKGKQILRINAHLRLMDTPGIMPKSEWNEESLVLVGAKNPYSLKDPDLAVFKLMEEHPGLIEKHYGVEILGDKDETLETIAVKLQMKKRGNLPDITRAAQRILQDWQDGKIHREFVFRPDTD